MSTKPATADEQAQIRELATRLLDVLDEYADFDHRITLAAIVDVLGVALGCVPCAECRRLSAKHLKGSVRDVIRHAMAVAEQQPEHEGQHAH
ncbi:MAG TPA: hypothetical protein VF913_12100 [Xanthobacteraceae bacterium]